MLSDLHGGQVQKLHFSGLAGLKDVHILRDDLIHPLVSGNKWRKLKFIIRHMQENGKNSLITFGGPYSNHLVATAVAGAKAGIRTTGIIRGDEKRPLNSFEKICLEYGMKLIHVSRAAYREPEAYIKTFIDSFNTTEIIGEGGRHPLAFEGCAEILDELPQTYDLIVLAVGTCTTMLGLVQGVFDRKLKTKIIGISSLKNNMEPDVLLARFPRHLWQMEYNYHRKGYAVNDTELMAYIERFRAETGIRLEHVYTGKAMMALEDMIRQNKIPKESRILFVHSGGLPSLLYDQ